MHFFIFLLNHFKVLTDISSQHSMFDLNSLIIRL
jgi:hypothetical protein